MINKTKDSQLRASRNYRLRSPEKVKEMCRQYNRRYYSDPERNRATSQTNIRLLL